VKHEASLVPHGLVRFTGLQEPHYSSGTRPDGRQFPELTPAARELLRRVAVPVAVNPDPYGIEERKARRRRG